ncbi:MAG: golgi uridine diphosphate-N- acetylglucosamine transporter [Alyxoria varia]|nr:MAG: golgi uridine diphosphate-N- acetylglucosamine transporter [Alyxoria varia]
MSLDGSLALIFGGCCSNVFALEAILKHEADSGLLITVFQFFIVALFSLPTQLERTPISTLRSTLSFDFPTPITPSAIRRPTDPHAPTTRVRRGWRFKPLGIPLQRIALMSFMFFAVNMLNNWAFAFDISVPMHIILRSFGSVTTLAVGWACGKKYSRVQVGSVAVLTVGVVVSAWADASKKGRSLSLDPFSTTNPASKFLPGLLVLFAAQFLSAWMGVYTETTYAQHGRHWRQSLFYTHALSLCFSIFFLPTLSSQFARLTASPPLPLPASLAENTALTSRLKISPESVMFGPPQALLYLGLNALTQFACISGVNRLASVSTAVTVTVVLNVRKLVSFLLSCFIFGNPVGGQMAVGAAVVFASGAVYGWDSAGRKRSSKPTAGFSGTSVGGSGGGIDGGGKGGGNGGEGKSIRIDGAGGRPAQSADGSAAVDVKEEGAEETRTQGGRAPRPAKLQIRQRSMSTGIPKIGEGYDEKQA